MEGWDHGMHIHDMLTCSPIPSSGVVLLPDLFVHRSLAGSHQARSGETRQEKILGHEMLDLLDW